MMTFTQLLLLHSLSHAHSFISQESEKSMSRWKQPIAGASEDIALAHHALVAYKQTFCSGSLIGSRIVLTVASCFLNEKPPYEIYVKFRIHNFLERGEIMGVVEKKEHEYFQYSSQLDNDIALLVLQNHVRFDVAVRKVVLSKPEFALRPFSDIVVTGWRKDISQSQGYYLLQSEMTVITPQECISTYPDILTASIFCATFDRANLLSDNGGAALHNGLVVGILSYGANVDEAPHVALFTNVSYFYKWIKLNTQRLLAKHCSKEQDTAPDTACDHDMLLRGEKRHMVKLMSDVAITSGSPQLNAGFNLDKDKEKL